jgi:hypothetical protein
VQRRLVGRAAADEHRHVEVGDEPLEGERLGSRRDVLGRHHGPWMTNRSTPEYEDGLRELHRPLRGERGRDGDPGVPDLLDPCMIRSGSIGLA